MAKEKKEKVEFDTETTIADMNIEGFKWYNPSKKKSQSSEQEQLKLTKKERRAVMNGALRALLPFIGVVLCVFVLVFALAYVWLN